MQLVQDSQITNKWWGQDLNPGSLTSEPALGPL